MLMTIIDCYNRRLGVQGLLVRFRTVFSCLLLSLVLSGCLSSGVPEGGEQLRADRPAALSSINALMRAGDWSGAQQRALAALVDEPFEPSYHLSLGIILSHLNEPEPAEAAVRNALLYQPDNLATLNYLGLILRRQGRFDDALQQYHEALRIKSDHAPSHRNVGILYELYLGEPELALSHYRLSQQHTMTNDPTLAQWIESLDYRLASRQVVEVGR